MRRLMTGIYSLAMCVFASTAFAQTAAAAVGKGPGVVGNANRLDDRHDHCNRFDHAGRDT